ncbi:lysozyme inhibitor LprI family protein [Leeia sp.]|uniref:lysozyme inhibitor LprI family protein n=1 Tax=Leeia sp. TaxID=2884678 RepID=UPI0035B178A5
MKRFCLWLLASMLSLPVLAASFDCSKAKAEDERAICKTPELSTLDETMAAHYKHTAQLLASYPARLKAFRQNQQEWVKERASCGDTVACLKQAYLMRNGWLAQPLHFYSGTWANARYSMTVLVQAGSNRPLVRLYLAPRKADKLLLMELQARFVDAAHNSQEGQDAVQLTPAFSKAYQQYEGLCSAVSLNFTRDDEAYLTSNENCPLFRDAGDETLRFIAPAYDYSPPP